MNKVAVDHQKEHRNTETQFTVPVSQLSTLRGLWTSRVQEEHRSILSLLPLTEHRALGGFVGTGRKTTP